MEELDAAHAINVSEAAALSSQTPYRLRHAAEALPVCAPQAAAGPGSEKKVPSAWYLVCRLSYVKIKQCPKRESALAAAHCALHTGPPLEAGVPNTQEVRLTRARASREQAARNMNFPPSQRRCNEIREATYPRKAEDLRELLQLQQSMRLRV